MSHPTRARGPALARGRDGQGPDVSPDRRGHGGLSGPRCQPVRQATGVGPRRSGPALGDHRLPVTGRLPDQAALLDLGRHRLKDLTLPEHVFQLTHLDLPAHFPPLKSLDAFRHNLQPNRPRPPADASSRRGLELRPGCTRRRTRLPRGVFAGGFDLGSAQAVCSLDGVESEVAAGLEALAWNELLERSLAESDPRNEHFGYHFLASERAAGRHRLRRDLRGDLRTSGPRHERLTPASSGESPHAARRG